jgi:hypothetical protein
MACHGDSFIFICRWLYLRGNTRKGFYGLLRARARVQFIFLNIDDFHTAEEIHGPLRRYRNFIDFFITYKSSPEQLRLYCDEPCARRLGSNSWYEIFHFSTAYRMVLQPTQPTVHWVQGLSSGAHILGSAHHPAPYSAEVKNAGPIHVSALLMHIHSAVFR